MKESIYMDTSVPSAYYDDREPEKLNVTRAFWERLKEYQVFISRITVAELSDSPPYKWEKFSKLIVGINELAIDSKIEKLANEYVKAKIIPVKYRPDALHIAIASIHKITYLVTWNCKHIAGAHKRKAIREYNLKRGIFNPEIAIPTEFVSEEV